MVSVIVSNKSFSSLHSTITAPAASPNNIQVVLSVKSVTFDKVSAPKTRIFLCVPAAISPFANISPLQKPAHAHDISMAPA